jgi:hypothetical protein
MLKLLQLAQPLLSEVSCYGECCELAPGQVFPAERPMPSMLPLHGSNGEPEQPCHAEQGSLQHWQTHLGQSTTFFQTARNARGQATGIRAVEVLPDLE